MIYLIPYLKFLLLYSGWISIFLYFFRVKKFFVLSSVSIFVVQLSISYLFIDKIDYFEIPSMMLILFAIFIGVLIFCVEYYIGTLNKNYRKIEKKEKINLSLMITFLILPISEEIYFRIFVYQWIKSFNLYNVNFNYLFVLTSAFVVILNHIQTFKNKIIFIQKFFVEGIFCSIIFLCFKNIWMMIVIHEVFNCITFLLYYDIGRKFKNGN